LIIISLQLHPNDDKLRERVKKLVQNKKFLQKELAARIGVRCTDITIHMTSNFFSDTLCSSESTISKYLNGRVQTNGWKTLAMKIRTKLHNVLEEINPPSPCYGLFVAQSSFPKIWLQTQSLSGRNYRKHLTRIQTLLAAPSDMYKREQSVKIANVQYNSPSNASPTSPTSPISQ
jgi:transcriptional regulator with XRE-family HTH domain